MTITKNFITHNINKVLIGILVESFKSRPICGPAYIEIYFYDTSRLSIGVGEALTKNGSIVITTVGIVPGLTK